MGSRELYSSVVTPKRRYTRAHDVFAANLNLALSPIESMVGTNFYDPKMSRKDASWMIAATDKAGGIANKGFWMWKTGGGGSGGIGKNKEMPSTAKDIGKAGELDVPSYNYNTDGLTRMAPKGLPTTSATETFKEVNSSNNALSLPSTDTRTTSTDYKQRNFDPSILSSLAGAVSNNGSNRLPELPEYQRAANANLVNQQKQIDYYNRMGSTTRNLTNLIDQSVHTNPSPAGLTNSTGTFAQSQFGDQYSKLGTMNAGPQYMADGGLLTKFKGNSHENGGIPLGKDVVEGNETMFSMDNQSDFIFSDRILYPKSKESFATKSKRIESKYKLRPNDPYGKKSQERELNRLAVEQETLKSTLKPKDNTGANHMAYGGPLNKSNMEAITAGANYMNYPDFNTPEATYGMYNEGLSKMTSKGLTTPTATETFKSINNPAKQEEPVAGAYKSNFLPTALGYAAQAASNLPAMFMKPDLATFSRVKFQPTSLAEARNEARRSRNLGLATARGIGARSNDIGQTMNYLSGTTAALNSQYGSLFNQSLMGEANANSELNMREQLANSEIERYQEGINTAEKDAIRNLKLQEISNVGTTAAMAGKDYMVSQGADAQINALRESNPDYTYKIVDGKLVPVRLKAMGGKRGKV